MGQPQIRALDFSFAYAAANPPASTLATAATKRPVLENINFEIPAGQFALLIGPTGAGKSTLLRHLVPALAPRGTVGGSLSITGTTALVQQDPENQIVTDLVFHEIAFALENRAVPTQIIRSRVSELAAYFGIEDLLESSTHSLSGGQKQLVNLAAAMIAEPEILILDEPTAELDPIASQNFLTLLQRINKETGTTILCCEHRLENVLGICDQVIVLSPYLQPLPSAVFEKIRSMASDNNVPIDACIAARASVSQTYKRQEFIASCQKENAHLSIYLPEPTQIALAVDATAASASSQATSSSTALKTSEALPLDVRSGRNWLVKRLQQSPPLGTADEKDIILRLPKNSSKDITVSIRDLCFRHEKHSPYVVQHLKADFCKGKTHAIVGGNGSGKTTLLSLLAGIYKPQLGKIKIAKNLRLSALPQNPKACFSHESLAAELNGDLDLAKEFGLEQYLSYHPHDLSGGQTQMAAIAKLLQTNPDIILLDEPTKGLDAAAKKQIGQMLDTLKHVGKTIITVTHDLSFAAAYSDYCSLLACGQLLSTGTTRDFFLGNSFYTTATNQMTKGMLDGCVLVVDVLRTLDN